MSQNPNQSQMSSSPQVTADPQRLVGVLQERLNAETQRATIFEAAWVDLKVNEGELQRRIVEGAARVRTLAHAWSALVAGKQSNPQVEADWTALGDAITELDEWHTDMTGSSALNRPE
jgi:hypothetical protein